MLRAPILDGMHGTHNPEIPSKKLKICPKTESGTISHQELSIHISCFSLRPSISAEGDAALQVEVKEK